jgi:hypothetical protein
MRDVNFIEGPGLTDGIFPNVNMAHPFGVEGVGPINRHTVVIVNGDRSVWVKKAKVGEDVAKHLSVFYALVGGLDLRLARTPADSAFNAQLP